MNEHVAQPGKGAPGDVRVSRTVVFVDPFGRLAYDLEVADDRVLHHFVLKKAGLPVGGEPFDLLDALEDVGQINARIFGHRGCASLRMRRRRSQ